MIIPRPLDLRELRKRLKQFPVVAIIGPRQCGKTTLARQYIQEIKSKNIHFFDLEDPTDLAKLVNPKLALSDLRGLIVIDEVQRKPDLFPVLRVLIDQKKTVKFLILGSASRDLLAQSSETLAGRISYFELSGFHLAEVDNQNKLWVRGGFPKSYLARNDSESFQWRQDFISTFLERDIPSFGIRIPSQTLRRFWMMLAHYHGQLFNASEIGRSLAKGDKTVKDYLDILTDTFMIRQLPPWHYNTKKRLVKTSKIYFRDLGIFHALLTIKNKAELLNQPKLGASWEGFALEEVIRHLRLNYNEVFFWAVHTGADLDLLFFRKGSPWGIEFKYMDAPKITSSMCSAMQELKLKHLWVIYPGKANYKLDKNISVLSINNLNSLKI